MNLDNVVLTWTNTAGSVTGFRIQRRAIGGATWRAVADPGPNATSYTQRLVPRNRTYEYRIRANNLFGSSPWVVVSVTTP